MNFRKFFESLDALEARLNEHIEKEKAATQMRVAAFQLEKIHVAQLRAGLVDAAASQLAAEAQHD